MFSSEVLDMSISLTFCHHLCGWKIGLQRFSSVIQWKMGQESILLYWHSKGIYIWKHSTLLFSWIMKEIMAFLWGWDSQKKSLGNMKGLLHFHFHPLFTYCVLEKKIRALTGKNFVPVLKSLYSEEWMDADHWHYRSSKKVWYRSLSVLETLLFSRMIRELPICIPSKARSSA